jgi:hypothetical protein
MVSNQPLEVLHAYNTKPQTVLTSEYYISVNCYMQIPSLPNIDLKFLKDQEYKNETLHILYETSTIDI